MLLAHGATPYLVYPIAATWALSINGKGSLRAFSSGSFLFVGVSAWLSFFLGGGGRGPPFIVFILCFLQVRKIVRGLFLFLVLGGAVLARGGGEEVVKSACGNDFLLDILGDFWVLFQEGPGFLFSLA